MAESSKKLKPLAISTKMIFIELLLSSEYIIKLFNLAGFLVHFLQFPRLLDKFEVWVSCEAVLDIFDQFFCLIS